MRAILLAAVAATLVAIAAAAPRWNELGDYTFDKFVGDFGRGYSRGSSEWLRREAVFNARLRDIKQHNADATQSYKRGVNQFSDWTEAEWRKYNRAQPAAADMSKAKRFASSDKPVLPKYVDYRRASPAVLTGVKNQGHCGNCWAHSAVESMESHFAIQFGQLPVLSQQQITSCSNENFGCGGGNFYLGWEYVQASGGLNEEWLYPFTDFFAHDSKSGTSACKNITKEFMSNFWWFPKANVSGMNFVDQNSATAAMDALAKSGPLSISVAAGLWMSYEGGIFHTNVSNPLSWELDHAVQLVGYGYDFDVNQDYWIVRNSWGTNWGEEGFIRLARPKVEPCADVQPYGKVCGTSGLLWAPGFPTVSQLAKRNV